MLATCDLDAVVIATPHLFHHEIAAAAIARGLHVLIEKPLVLDPADGRRLIEAARTAGVEIVVGYTWHYNRQVLRAREWIAAGRIGTVNYVQSFFGSSPVNLYQGHPELDEYAYGAGDGFDGPLPSTYSDPRLAGGGQGQTQLTHSIALLLFLTGLDPERVAAFMENGSAAVDVVDAISLRFRGGALGVVGSTGAVVPTTHTDTLEYILHGSVGHIQFDVMDGELRLYGSDGVTDEAGPAGRRSLSHGGARSQSHRRSPWAVAERLTRVVRATDRRGPRCRLSKRRPGRDRHRREGRSGVTSQTRSSGSGAERVAIITGRAAASVRRSRGSWRMPATTG